MTLLVIIPIVRVLLILIIAGVVMWFVNRYIPMEQAIKTILNVVVVLLLIIWLLNVFGLI